MFFIEIAPKDHYHTIPNNSQKHKKNRINNPHVIQYYIKFCNTEQENLNLFQLFRTIYCRDKMKKISYKLLDIDRNMNACI